MTTPPVHDPEWNDLYWLAVPEGYKPVARDEFRQWLAETHGASDWMAMCNADGCSHLAFENEQAALLYKLRWM